MPVKSYPQLDERAHRLLAEAVERHGSRAVVAARLGYARTAVSQALNRCYPADASRLAARIVEIYADHVACPHLAREIPTGECRQHRERPLSTANRDAIKQWQACRLCPLNPKTEIRHAG